MKRLLLLTAFAIAPLFCNAQSLVLDSCGLDSKAVLNTCEADYFNETLKGWPGDFNFKNKKVGFAYGNYGSQLISKKEYFARWGKAYYSRNSNVGNQLFLLSDKEKEMSGGYDAIIISWSKPEVSPRHKKKIIRKLRNRKPLTQVFALKAHFLA